jgi:hypothetical protein
MYLVRHTLQIFPVIAYLDILEREREGSRRRSLALRVRVLQSPSAFLFKWAIPRKRAGQGSVNLLKPSAFCMSRTTKFNVKKFYKVLALR